MLTIREFQRSLTTLLVPVPNKPQIRPIQKWIINAIHRLRGTIEFAAKATLETIDTPQTILARFEISFERCFVFIGHPPEIVFFTSARFGPFHGRSEERRVGKGGRSRWSAYH